MRPSDLLLSVNLSGSSGPYGHQLAILQAHAMEICAFICLWPPPLSPSLPTSPLSLTVYESICKKSGQDKDRRVRFKEVHMSKWGRLGKEEEGMLASDGNRGSSMRQIMPPLSFSYALKSCL
jgi:hypothetical protein